MDNVTVSCLSTLARFGLVGQAKRWHVAFEVCKRAKVKMAGPRAPIASLSGGNQQKAMLGRLIATKPRVLVLNDPMRGVDLGAKHDLYGVLSQLASEGMAVLLLSTELAELCLLCDRVLIFHDQGIAAAIDRGKLDEATLIGAMFGQYGQRGARRMMWLARRSYAWPVIAAVTVFALLNALASPAFLSPANWNGLLVGAAPFIILAMAQTPPVLSGDGGIDLSVGPLAGMVNALVTSVLVPNGWSDPISVLGISLAVGIASGLLNGFMIAVVRVQPIIATLGTFLAYQGITLEMLPMAGGMAPDWLRWLSASHAGIPGVLLPLAVIALAWLALERTAYRRNLLATGGDSRAAYASGVNIIGVRLIAYILAGILAAVAGLVFTAALGSATPPWAFPIRSPRSPPWRSVASR